MELKLDRKEIEDILLQWAEDKFPGSFNTVHIGGKYHHITDTDFSFEHPKETEDTPLPIPPKAEA